MHDARAVQGLTGTHCSLLDGDSDRVEPVRGSAAVGEVLAMEEEQTQVRAVLGV